MPPPPVPLVYLCGVETSSRFAMLIEETRLSNLPVWLLLPELRGRQILCWKGHPLTPADSDRCAKCYICGFWSIQAGSPMLWCEPCNNWCVCAKCASLPRLPMLHDDLLFQGRDDPCLLEWAAGQQAGTGTVIICPGGNYEFLCSN